MKARLFATSLSLVAAAAAAAFGSELNLALFATPSTSFVSGHETLEAINDGFEPRHKGDHSHGAYGNWPQSGTQWVQYDWSQPIHTRKVDVYWWDDGQGVRLPVSARLLYWDGKAFAPLAEVGVVGGRYNTATFAEVTTPKLRLEMTGSNKFSTGIIEWKVYDAGNSPKFAPRIVAGPDRIVVLPAKTYLHPEVRGPSESVTWSKASGPGEVTFGDGTAQFSTPGDYVLKVTAVNGQQSASDTLRVRVETATPKPRLDPIPTRVWKVNSPLWTPRLKQQIVHWIPHCIAKLSDPALKEGGIQNFIEAGNKNAGRPYKPHIGAPWANAYTLNTVEAMCLALLLDPQGDAEIVQAQKAIRAKLDEWIPILLAAQEPDGYLQTRFTLAAKNERWTHVGDHEGYVAGYFIDAAIAHYWLTGNRQMYDAAKKLADCWDAHIGPSPKKTWYDGHQALEMALVRLARLVNEVEGAGKGDKYIRLSKFLLDCRRNGSSYDQTHLPVVQQYEAVGHAVRAAYLYSGMADIAMETGDAEYQSAVKSLWDNLVNKKYYITGGIGSGETAEGFGKNYSLPNHAYCESCADCGELFFQYRMNLAYHEARYADLMEETLYNAILGSVDLPARNFTYTNPLDQSHERYPWHGCPCCIGNIPRTLLMLPTWMYTRSSDGLFVNLYVGSTVRVAPDLEIVQRTDYPWKGAVEIIINPVAGNVGAASVLRPSAGVGAPRSLPRFFALHLRAPNRNVSALYRATPDANGLAALTVNGQPVTPEMKDGYAVIRREWKSGDTVRFELPLRVQRVRADQRVVADRGRVALRYGPLIYNIESVDQNIDGVLLPDTPLVAEWKPDLLEGVVAIRGRFADGSPLLAIPNYARNNRGGRSIVWIAATDETRPAITRLDPPERDFFSKQLLFHGLPIKAHEVVADEALQAAYDRLSLMLGKLPAVTAKLIAAGVELHIIGRNQVTTDLPEWRHDKGKPLDEYHGQTRDQRTRGMGGKLVSCGEENLLKLDKDPYRGRDICVHEFAHVVRTYGMTKKLRARFDEQYRKSLDAGRWRGSYAGKNPDEFFAELSMWYFGTHGDLGMTGPKPDNGPDGLKRYDPEAFALFDEFYGGRMGGE